MSADIYSSSVWNLNRTFKFWEMSSWTDDEDVRTYALEAQVKLSDGTVFHHRGYTGQDFDELAAKMIAAEEARSRIVP